MFQKLIQWSQTEFQQLPWRKERSLYSTLVSEIMLQQTTVSSVVKYFNRFMQQYPGPENVASATEEQLLISWKGLGYYRRAKNLKKACEVICDDHAGKIPLNYETLIQIPGIGDYTANAILAIGADKKRLAIDANLERVLARIYGLEEYKGPKLVKKIKETQAFSKELTQFGGRLVNEALMDLGRNYCQARKSQCDLCPLNVRCVALKTNKVLSIPRVKEKLAQKAKEKHKLKLLRVLFKKGDNFLVYKKKAHQWLSGQYEVPTFILDTTDKNIHQYPRLSGDFALIDFDLLPEFKSAITKYSIINKVLWVDEKEFANFKTDKDDYCWGCENLSTASIKAINL